MSNDSSQELRPVSARSMPPLIDVDCNLWHCDLKSLQKINESNNSVPWEILAEDAIETANIVAMLSPSSTIDEARKGLDLMDRHPPPLPIKTTVGVHPYHVNDDEFQRKTLSEHKEAMISLLTNNASKCAAVGECGLDATDGFPPIDDQLPWFKLQIEVAQELNLSLFVHERLAFDETMQLLENVHVPIIIHCFTGTLEECQAYLNRGYSISVSGFILKESNDNCDQVLSCLRRGIIPLDRLMIETDAPYMGFDNCRQYYLEHNQDYVASLNSKKRKRLQQSTYPNVPSSLPLVLQKVTECLQQNNPSLTIEKVAAATTHNARSFFGL
ncbi:TatD-related deoxyribonuclease [Nitzschia inconspicua]|uniref:TatD-related deoxyribonuclease n=1 Tax=Nitzschia inconspicua TaxID=303405 RepID=A0A9K3PFF3_9STRA|nr:TatD-related deoxyribonuclease [Nitzschia inconspicua]